MPESPQSFEQKVPLPEQSSPNPDRAAGRQFETAPPPGEWGNERRMPSVTAPAPATQPAQLPVSGAVSLQEIEAVLSHDLEELYFQLPPDRQLAFKQKGEETARAIKSLLDTAKINTKKIARLIIDWLKLIPGVNRFFLEQESKIKTDEILKLQGTSNK